MKSVKDYINLLPPKDEARSRFNNRAFLPALLFTLAWLGLFGWQATRQWELRSRLAPLTAQKLALQRQADAMRKGLGITDSAGTGTNNAALIQSLLDERVLWSEVFRQFSMLVPKGLWFDSLEGNTTAKAEVRIKGGAVNYLSIAAFMLAMEKSGYFINPRLSYAQKITVRGREVVGFEITCGIMKKQEARDGR
jgi:Tfp pilus assembly protein PilN